jgi:carboxyl-terminal processing protease
MNTKWMWRLALLVLALGSATIFVHRQISEAKWSHYQTDNGATIRFPTKGLLARLGRGVVVWDYEEGLPEPKSDLNREERLENFDILAEAFDRYFSFFIVKNIEWENVRSHYRALAAEAEGREYYNVLARFVRELKDSHSYLCNYDEPVFQDWVRSEIRVRRIEGKAVVTNLSDDSNAFKQGVRIGSVITEVDGVPINDRIEQLRGVLRVRSSEQSYLDTANKQLLHGPQEDGIEIAFLPPGGKEVLHATLTRKDGIRRRQFRPPFPLHEGDYVWYGTHPSGVGYIRIVSFGGRMKIVKEFESALEDLREAPSLMLDIRDNPGGFGTGQHRIIGRFLSQGAKGNTSYRRSGPGHDDFSKRTWDIQPSGDWQYSTPVALLFNVGTGSASDLFAAGLISTGRVITVGTPTNGNVTGTCVFAILPCGLVVRISHGYIADADGNVIEGRGNIPKIRVERTVEDVINGTDSVIERAVAELKSRIGS